MVLSAKKIRRVLTSISLIQHIGILLGWLMLIGVVAGSYGDELEAMKDTVYAPLPYLMQGVTMLLVGTIVIRIGIAAYKNRRDFMAIPATSRGKLIACFLVFLGLGVVMQALKPPPKVLTPAEQRLADRDKALYVAKHFCRELIKERLHDPDSAVYENKHAGKDYARVIPLKKSQDMMFEVHTALRARNGFGAYRRMVVVCEYLHSKDGRTLPVGIRGL